MAGKNKIMQAVVSFAGTIDPSLGKAMDNVAGHLDKVNWKAVAVGAAVGGIAVATGKAVVEAGKYLAELGDDYNKAMNQLSASTGATGDELDALGESVKNIYAQNLGEDFNDVAEGLAATQKASDLAGEALEQATAAGFVLRDTFDYDISESARAASALMKNFNISAEEAYGLIATGAQNGADKNGDLLDTLNEYSAQFAALGLSADQFMGPSWKALTPACSASTKWPTPLRSSTSERKTAATAAPKPSRASASTPTKCSRPLQPAARPRRLHFSTPSRL